MCHCGCAMVSLPERVVERVVTRSEAPVGIRTRSPRGTPVALPRALLSANHGPWKPTAKAQPRPEAGARHERTLSGVGCSALIPMEAPSAADHRGLLALGQRPTGEEETPGDSTPSRITITAA